MGSDLVSAEEARKLLVSSTAGRNGGTMRREHRTLYAAIPGEGADAGNVREYTIGTAHIATGDAALWEASGALARTVVALSEERDEARRERDRLRDIVACERGERAPEGWTFHTPDMSEDGDPRAWWYRDLVTVLSTSIGWERFDAETRARSIHRYALEAIEQADKAAGVERG